NQRAISESSAPPVQVILTSGTPTRRITAPAKSQSIVVRPMCKKDIFYSGSTLTLPPNQSVQHLAESQVGFGASTIMTSVVSIPAKDINDKVQKQLASREGRDDTAEYPSKYAECCAKVTSFLTSFRRGKKTDAESEVDIKEEQFGEKR